MPGTEKPALMSAPPLSALPPLCFRTMAMVVVAMASAACTSPGRSLESASIPVAAPAAPQAQEVTAVPPPQTESDTRSIAPVHDLKEIGLPSERVPATRRSSGKRIRFLADSTEIDEQSMKLLLAGASRLKADPKMVVTLVAHTENGGSRSYNIALAEEEINAVSALLRSFGVPVRQIRHRSAGRRRSSTNCTSPTCKQEMRYVDLFYE